MYMFTYIFIKVTKSYKVDSNKNCDFVQHKNKNLFFQVRAIHDRGSRIAYILCTI